MKKNIAATVGLIFAPFAAAIIGAIFTPINAGGDLIALGLIPIFYFFSAAATLFFGMPVFFLLRHFNLINWWSSISSGLFVGGLTGVVLRLPNSSRFQDLLLPMAIGSTSALVFWLIYRLGKR